MYRRFGIAASLVGLFWCGIAYAADPAHRPEPAKVTSTPTFVQQAVVGNLFEVESSMLALDRSQNATVKTFAKSMVDDHSAAGVKLADAVDQAKQARPPLKLDARHQAILDDLAAKKGADFDKLYVEAHHKAHVEVGGSVRELRGHGRRCPPEGAGRRASAQAERSFGKNRQDCGGLEKRSLDV